MTIESIQRAEQKPSEPEPISIRAADGFTIKGFLWRHPEPVAPDTSVVIINTANSVRCGYYSRFASFLFRNGFDVITYDYRGIGVSRPASLKGFDAGWTDWGERDFDAVIRFALETFPGRPIDVAAHSVGGFILGFAESSRLVRRVFTMGAQYAYWRDYAPGDRARMFAKWHVAMPLVTLLFGYFPGKRLGWLEDTPKGVVRDWAFSRPRFEDVRGGSWSARYPDKRAFLERFAAVTAPTLAVSVTDDEFGTIPATERLLAYYTGSPRTHLRISPESIGEPSIGHFPFFNSKFEEKLWRIPLEWLRSGNISEDWPGEIITPENRG
ncbi:MAG: alpha/beta fold hydrolase [Candidatus Dadabacteria bacterium]|nr:alpha/beta fold hydrolase [Candidatus Dadabacteria bacterium]